MADLADVEIALVALIGQALFPQVNAGWGGPQGYGGGAWANPYQAGASQLSPVTGGMVKLYRGWPEQASLNSDLTNGVAHCTVFPEPGMTRNTTRFAPVTRALPGLAPTLTATVSGATVTIGGSVTPGNVAGVQFGGAALASAYAVIAGQYDRPDTIAAALAAKIPGASATGAVVTLASGVGLSAGVMCPQPALTEVRRQDQGFRVSCWCPTPAVRDALAGAADQALASLRDAYGRLTRFVALRSGEQGWLRYRSAYTNDFPARDRVWRRDLCYLVEYPTTAIEQDPVMLFGGIVTNADGALTATGAMQPATSVQTDANGNVLIDAGGNLIGVRP